eukprot:TRINITY_DN18195_c0_g1_i1.p1 TRINITY_DN18195_c0_g1~~TRINITY_DN18195_c0_g1_i1.p1  ORF type:complete len:243 (+),score=85.08 TRINITY_DN18195_c0_g1_i1:129-857(+)
MSLLLEDVERRWQTKLELAERDAASQIRAVEAKARMFEMETRAAANKAIADAEWRAREAERRERDALEAQHHAEMRAEAEHKRANETRQCCEDMLAQERQAMQDRLDKMQQQMELAQADEDRRCQEMQDMMREAQAREAQAVEEARNLGQQAQLDAERRAKMAEASADEAIEANRALTLAQFSSYSSMITRAQEEANARVDQAQLHAMERVEIAARFGLDALYRSRVFADAKALAKHRAKSV